MARGSSGILDDVIIYSTFVAALYGVDFIVATTTRSHMRFRYYATPQQLLPLLEEKAQ